MLNKTLFSLLVIFLLVFGCGSDKKKQWAEGDYGRASKLNLDVDAVSKAFETAKSPQEFEKKVNEIYTGDEIISIAVKNTGEKKQSVVLYIDSNPQNAKIDKGEKLLAFNRDFDTESNKSSYTRTGYGPYGYYSHHSPIYYAAIGVFTYWALSRSFYRTPMSSYSTIRSRRNSHRSTPAYKKQVAKTNSFNKSFQKNAPKKFKSGPSGAWGKKSAGKGGWFGGRKRSSTGKSRGFGRRSRGFGGRRSFGGRRR